MPSLKDIRRRIVSIKSTQKITRAMKLVSAAKFARANTAVVSSRPYGQAFDDMLRRLVEVAGEKLTSPLLEVRDEKRILVAVLATDRGFCGSLNSNLFKQTLSFVEKKRRSGVAVEVVPWGKRARLFAAKTQLRAREGREKVLDRPNYQTAKGLANELVTQFLEGGYDRVYIAFVEFRSALSQSPKIMQLLPLGRDSMGGEGKAPDPSAANIIVEPDIKTMADGLLKRAVASQVFRALLEGSASEHGARMTAMDSATNNASEVLRKMNLQYARARQAAITKELIEITSGAQAL